MVDQAPVNSLLTAFTATKEEQIGGVIRQAQRLVNLYHHLTDFTPEFLDVFNKQLTEASSDVQRTMNDLQGGNIVRQYADFIRVKTAPAQTADEPSEHQERHGYLPGPEDETAGLTGAPAMASGASLTQGMKALQETIEKMQSTHQQATLTTLEKLIQTQTKALADVLQQLSQHTQELGQQQQNLVSNFIEGMDAPYSDVIEDEKSILEPPAFKRATISGTPVSAFVPSQNPANAQPPKPRTPKG